MKTLREYIEIVKQLSLLEWAPTPEQTKWLGGANQQDPYIMNRMPGAKPPVTWFTSPEDQALAKRMGFPATEPAAPAAPAAEPAPAAVATPVAEPTKIEPTPLAPAPAATAPKPPAGQAAKPAGPNPVMTLQNKLIGLGAKIKADGIMGPATQAAMKEYGLDANGNPVKDKTTGQPVTNDKTANAIIQRGGIPPAEITKDMTVAQQIRSDFEGQRANNMTPSGAPTYKRADGQEVYKTAGGKEVAVGSLTDIRNKNQAEYQAQNQAFLAKQAELKAAKAAASGQPPAQGSRSPVTASSTTLPDGTPIERSQGNSSPEYMAQFGGQAPNQGGSVPPAPVNPAQKAAWAKQYGGKYDPKTGAPLSEGTGYDEIDRLIGLVHYR